MEQGFLASTDGVSLFFRAVMLRGEHVPSALLVHGYGEHSGRYVHIMRHFEWAGFSSLAIDVRGHGQSSGRRGHVDRYDDYLDDITTGLRALEKRSGGPVFLVAHSNGGLIAALYLAERAYDVKGAVLSSPMMGWSVRIPRWKRMIGNTMSRVLPQMALGRDIDAGVLSHNDEANQGYLDDALNHRVATARWFTEAKEAQLRALVGAYQIHLPILVLQAGDDRVVSVEATERFFGVVASADKELVLYPGLYHELFNEPESPDILDETTRWMRGRCS